MRKWNGLKWAACPETDELAFNDIALILGPKSSRVLEAAWGCYLEAGRYKLIKKIHANGQEFICETEFCLV